MRGRALLLLLLVPLLAPSAPAQGAGGGTQATLDVEVQADHAEAVTLRFEGLRRLTEYHGICLPRGATPTRVHDSLGDVPYTKGAEEDGRVTVTFRARTEEATIVMARPAPSAEHAPFFEGDANFCVPDGTRSTMRVRVPEGHEVFFVSGGGSLAADGREATVSKDGPLHAFYSYEAPLDAASGLVAVDAAPFHLVAPAARAQQAREVARAAAPALRAAMAEAGLDLPWDLLRVRYAPSTEFSWEAGHYGGHGLVTIREASLDPDPQEGYPYVPARVLVHEAFHAVSAPYGKGPVEETLDWWLEGSARHAESHVDAVLPNGSRHCEKDAREVRCWSFDDRPTEDDLAQAYAASFQFERRWSPSLEQSPDTRSFYYRYSGYLVGAYARLHGEAALRAVWDDLAAAFEAGEGCPCREGWLEGVLLRHADGAETRDLVQPRADLRRADPAAFDAWAKPLVKDEDALQEELDRAAGSGSILVPGAGAPLLLLAGLGAALAIARRRA